MDACCIRYIDLCMCKSVTSAILQQNQHDGLHYAYSVVFSSSSSMQIWRKYI